MYKFKVIYPTIVFGGLLFASLFILAGCDDGILRGSVSPTTDGKTYLVFLPDSFKTDEKIIEGVICKEKGVPHAEGDGRFYKIKYTVLGGKEMSAED